MIIGIDGNEANVEKRVGIGEYSFELLKQFKEYQISSFDFAQDKNIKYQIYLKDKPREDLPEESAKWKYRIVGPSKLWTQIGLPFDLYFHKPRPDVFFSPTHYAPRFSPIPTVISIMDLSYIHFPELFRKSDLYQLRNWTAYSVRNAKKILTISQASKDDIIKEYGVPEDKVIVTYPGIKLKTQMSKLKTTTQNSKLLKERYGIEGVIYCLLGRFSRGRILYGSLRHIVSFVILNLFQDLSLNEILTFVRMTRNWLLLAKKAGCMRIF
jgi:glycosyltransferase involved in cell wall biosynthesis